MKRSKRKLLHAVRCDSISGFHHVMEMVRFFRITLSGTQERGLKGVKIQIFLGFSMSLDPSRSLHPCQRCFGNWSQFIPDLYVDMIYTCNV